MSTPNLKNGLEDKVRISGSVYFSVENGLPDSRNVLAFIPFNQVEYMGVVLRQPPICHQEDEPFGVQVRT